MGIDINPAKEAVEILGGRLAFEWNILPLKIEQKILYIGTSSPDDKKMKDDISFSTGLSVQTIKIPSELIIEKLKDVYGSELTPDIAQVSSHQRSSANEHTTVELVNKIIDEAIEKSASDIHMESYEHSFRVRYRIDGQLREIMLLPLQRSAQIISRIKIMANMDISEKRKPQDGKIKFTFNLNEVDIRVSTLPTGFGEKTVLRILDKTQIDLDIEKLGFSHNQIMLVKTNLQRPYGLILVTGPTGSGKSTTIYSFLQSIHTIEKNIMTIEDPIEYNLTGINQCNVKPDIGFNFATALRAFLRQDPDIIMVGEIRDKETADIAVRAALTGHLVFSTLHTNDSASAITRLLDMGIDSYLVAASLKLVIAQRLVRKLCKCKIGLADNTGNQFTYVKNGCIDCSMTGFKGRTALFEVLEITSELGDMISGNRNLSEIKNKAAENGFITLRETSSFKIKMGITTNDEVVRETTL